MSVNWSWKIHLGYYVQVQEHNGKIQKWHINLYGANCLCAHIWDFKGPSDDPTKIDPKTGERQIVDKYQFCGWWNDREHLENCLGLHANKGYSDTNIYAKDNKPFAYIEKLCLNTYYLDHIKDIIKPKILEAFAKGGTKVVFYYKKPKKEKSKE